MSWSSLTIDAEAIKVRESVLFSTWSDANVQAVQKSVAKDMMERDLLDVISADDLDTYAVTYADDMKRALAYLQLHLFFMDNHAGDGSVNAMKATHYMTQYQRERQRFKTFTGDQVSTNTIQAWR